MWSIVLTAHEEAIQSLESLIDWNAKDSKTALNVARN